MQASKRTTSQAAESGVIARDQNACRSNPICHCRPTAMPLTPLMPHTPNASNNVPFPTRTIARSTKPPLASQAGGTHKADSAQQQDLIFAPTFPFPITALPQHRNSLSPAPFPLPPIGASPRVFQCLCLDGVPRYILFITLSPFAATTTCFATMFGISPDKPLLFSAISRSIMRADSPLRSPVRLIAPDFLTKTSGHLCVSCYRLNAYKRCKHAPTCKSRKTTEKKKPPSANWRAA